MVLFAIMSALLLLHGALGSSLSMAPLSQQLKNQIDVFAIDFSGHGNASWPENGFSMETFEDDVLRFVDSQNLNSVHIFGYSMGGFVGLRLAMKFPERIKSLSTLATKFDWNEATCQQESQMLDADLLQEKSPKFVQALSDLHAVHGWRKMIDETRNLLGGMHQYIFSDDQLNNIKFPVRIMLGDRDKMVRLDETIKVFQSLQNAELAVLPGTPHPLEKVSTSLLSTLILQQIKKLSS